LLWILPISPVIILSVVISTVSQVSKIEFNDIDDESTGVSRTEGKLESSKIINANHDAGGHTMSCTVYNKIHCQRLTLHLREIKCIHSRHHERSPQSSSRLSLSTTRIELNEVIGPENSSLQ
jgi:hypothetical protein